jgi:hypothetical protein
MAADYLKRFDWALAARIRKAGPEELVQLLEERRGAWRAAGRRPCSDLLALALRSGRPVAEILDELLAEGCTLTELQNDAVCDLCLQGEDVRLGADGLYAEVFPADLEGALSSLDVLPGTDEELFLLLRPQHLDLLLRALREQEGQALPSPVRLDAIARLRDAIASQPGQMVALCFDA